MGNPKHKHSKARSRKRHANWTLARPAIAPCPRCHEPKLPHRACPNCGYYRDRKVLAVGDEG